MTSFAGLARTAAALATRVTGRPTTVQLDKPVPDAVHTAPGEVTIDPRVFADEWLGYSTLDSVLGSHQNPSLAGAVIMGAVWAAHTDPQLVGVEAALDRVRAEARHVTARPQDHDLLVAAAARLTAWQVADSDRPTEVVAWQVIPRVAVGLLPVHAGVVLLAGLGVNVNQSVHAQLAAVGETLRLSHSGDAAALRRARLLMQHILDNRDGQTPDGDGTGNESGAAGPGGDTADGDTESGANDSDEETDDDAPGDANGDGDTAEAAAAILDEIVRAATEACFDVADEFLNPAPDPEAVAAAADLRQSQAAFPPGGTGGTIRGKPVIKHETPTAADLRYADDLAAQLRQARHRTPTSTPVPSAAPPGRMRGNQLLQAHAQRMTGQTVTAKPWATRRPNIPPEPPLTAGFVVDASGSMSRWYRSAAVAMWATTKVAREFGGSAAAVTFSGVITSIIGPAGPILNIPIPTHSGGSTGCPDAIRAVSGALRLPHSPGVRLLVVLTDSALPDRELIHPVTERLAAAGVTVVWAHCDRRGSGWAPRGAQLVTGFTAGTFPLVVGRFAADALSAAVA